MLMPEESTAPVKHSARVYRYAGGVFVLFIAAVAVWYFGNLALSGNLTPSEASEVAAKKSESFYNSLLQKSPDFAQGQSARREGDYVSAQQYFEKAFSEAKDDAKKGLIAYWLADAYAANARYKESVALLQGIAHDTRYASIIRAYAVQKMALMYRQYWDPVITDEVFKHPVFAPMLVQDDPTLSYRRLFEYATTLYPLALSEFYVADWYADDALYAKFQVRNGSIEKSVANVRVGEDKAVIWERILAGNQHIRLVQDGVVSDESIYAALERRAAVIGKMQRLGDNSFGDAEAEFKNLLAKYESDGIMTDGTVRLQYAIFLARMYKDVRVADIQAILSPIYDSPTYRSPSLGTAMKALKDVPSGESATKAAVAYIAGLDPEFKKFLSSLGWDDTDFAEPQ